MNEYQTFAEQAYQQLLSLEASAETEQLFTYSYLLGHISLISSADGESKQDFIDGVTASLSQAYKVDHLDDDDKTAINTVWKQLIQA